MGNYIMKKSCSLPTTLLKIEYIIYIIATATLIVSSFWGLFFMAPSLIKAIYSLCIWFCVFIFPYKLIKSNHFIEIANYLLRILLAMALIQIFRSAFSTEKYMYVIGNKWITLFGNEYTSLLFLPPLFTYLGTLKYSIYVLKRATLLYLFIGLLLSLFGKFPIAILSTYALAFYPYVNKKYKILIIIAFIEAIIKSSFGENPTRMYLIIILFSLIAYFLVYTLKSKRIMKIFAITVIISPIILFIPTLFLSGNKTSTFQQIQKLIIQKSGNEDMAIDTRTFLYMEMADDLSKTDSWLFGKGAFSKYYSSYFDQSNISKYGRISSEVPLLNYLLRGGIAYVLIYFAIILFAAYLAIWKGNNQFVQYIGIIALGWYFNSFVGDITGCRFYHIAFFILIGCCLSKQWLYLNNYKINHILKL